MRKLFIKPLDTAADYFPEFMCALMTMAWGGMLLLPADTFSVSSGYKLLAQVAPEWLFGAVFLGLGYVNLHSLISNNWSRVRKSAVALLFCWSLVALGFAIAAPASAAWPLFVGLATLFGWSAARHKKLRP